MMKKITLAALCAASAIYAGTFETWIGADYATRVETGLGNETNTYGIWYDFNDYYEIETYMGGKSRPGSWLYTVSEACYEPEYECVDYYFDPVVEYCAAICGTAQLREGAPTTQPFVGVAFNVVGKVSKDSPILATGDASAWGGLCVTYSSEADIYLELGLGNAIDSTMNYALPAVKLPASKTDNRVIASWSDFKQPSGYEGSVKFDGETAAKQLASIKFKIQADSGDYDFNICAVGPKDGTCPEKCILPWLEQENKIARGVSAIKTNLNGRTLGFTGIKSTATVEVMNSLGQVVIKRAIGNSAQTLNLAALKAGVYLIHVVGKSTNLVRKILLK
jgi:hypothetical protein